MAEVAVATVAAGGGAVQGTLYGDETTGFLTRYTWTITEGSGTALIQQDGMPNISLSVSAPSSGDAPLPPGYTADLCSVSTTWRP